MKTKNLLQINMKIISLVRLFVLLGLVLSLLAGCGTTARNVARLELAQITAYEEQIDKKVIAEKYFLEKTVTDIEERYQELSPFALSSSIINRSNQAADEFIGQPVKNVTDWDVMKFVRNAITDYQSNRMQWEEVNMHARERFNTNIISLEIEKKHLKEVRKKIEELQKEPTDADQIMELQAFIKGTQAAYKKLDEQQESK